MKRSLALVLAPLLAVGCAASDDIVRLDSSANRDVRVLANGFGGDPAFGGDDEQGVGWFVWAAAVIENATDSIFAVSVTFQAVDRQGTRLGEAQRNEWVVLRAHERNAVGVVLVVPFGTTPADVIVSAARDELDPAMDPAPASRLAVTSVTYSPPAESTASGTTGSVRGTLMSTYLATVPAAVVTAVCRDEHEDIIGGGDAVVRSIPPGHQLPVEVEQVWVSRRPARCELFAAQARKIIQGRM